MRDIKVEEFESFCYDVGAIMVQSNSEDERMNCPYAVYCTFDHSQIIDTSRSWSIYGQIAWPPEIVIVLWFVVFFLLNTSLVFVAQTIVV